MSDTPDDLHDISRPTVAYYDGSAQSFWEGTRDHDVSQNYAAILNALGAEGAHRLLDLGCGPGRDLRFFREAGHDSVGLDAAPEFVRMAREYSGCEVWHQDFLALDLPDASFDGVFANATLQHVPSRELPRVLGELSRALRPEGVLFLSVPRGDNQEGFRGERYSHFADLPAWRGFVTDAGFTELRHYFRPEGRPRPEQPWLAMVLRRGRTDGQ